MIRKVIEHLYAREEIDSLKDYSEDILLKVSREKKYSKNVFLDWFYDSLLEYLTMCFKLDYGTRFSHSPFT